MATNKDLARWFQNNGADANDFVRVGKDGKIPKNLINMDFDDVIEGYYHDSKFYAKRSGESPSYIYSDEIIPETGELYSDLASSNIYRWGGTSYVLVGGGGGAVTLDPNGGLKETENGLAVSSVTNEEINDLFYSLGLVYNYSQITGIGTCTDSNIILPHKNPIARVNITSIAVRAFYQITSFNAITLPVNITTIGNSAFNACNDLTDIYYEGTTTQWNNITKGTNWDANTGNYTIHCSDGDINKN